MDFIKEHFTSVIALGPRTEALETPILDPVKERSEWGYINTEITVDETRSTDVG